MSKTFLIFIILFFLFVFGGLFLAASYSKANRPAEVGQGRLSEKEDKPNFVSSRARDPKRLVEPLRFEGEEAAAWAKAKEAVSALPKTKIITNQENYLHAESRSALFGFVDDVELELIPGANRIDVRSGSRVGRSDLGANAKRIEALRAEFSK